MGREPTKKEVNNFLKVIESEAKSTEDVKFEKFPELGDIFSGIPSDQDDRQLPEEPYTPDQAIQNLEHLGFENPSDREINDWLFEHNEPLFLDPRFDDFEMPGITSTYQSTSQNDDILSSTNIFVLLLVLVLTVLFCKFKKKANSDDDYVAAKDDENDTIFASLQNPFKRKNNRDDDFDKVL